MKRLILVSDLHHRAYQLEQKVFQLQYLYRQQLSIKVPVFQEIAHLENEMNNQYTEMTNYWDLIQKELKKDGGNNLIFR